MSEFKNEEYIKNIEKEYKRISRAYCRFLSYHLKLYNNDSLTEEQNLSLNRTKDKLKRKVAIMSRRLEKEDFNEVSRRDI